MRGSADEPAARDIALYFPRAPVASSSLSLHLSLVLCVMRRRERERAGNKWDRLTYSFVWLKQGICIFLKEQLNRAAMMFRLSGEAGQDGLHYPSIFLFISIFANGHSVPHTGSIVT